MNVNITGSIRPPDGTEIDFGNLGISHIGLLASVTLHLEGLSKNKLYFAEALVDGTTIGCSCPTLARTADLHDVRFEFHPSLFVGQQVVGFRYFRIENGRRIDLTIEEILTDR